MSIKVKDKEIRKVILNSLINFIEVNDFKIGNMGDKPSYGPKNAIGFDYSALFGEDRIVLETLMAKLSKFGITYYDEEKTDFHDYSDMSFNEYTKSDMIIFPEGYTNLKDKMKLVESFMVELEAKIG